MFSVLLSDHLPGQFFRQRGRVHSLAAGLLLALIVAAASVALWPGQPAPAPALSFRTTKGEEFALADLRGKVVLVNFWATSCAICVHEMPKMIATWRQYHGQGFESVAIAMPYDPPNLVLDYAETRQLPFKVTLDIQGTATAQFGQLSSEINATPALFLLDKQGRIVEKMLGQTDFEKLHRLIEQQLAA